MLVIPRVERQRQEDAWDNWASQHSQSVSSSSQWEAVSQKQGGCNWGRYLRLISGTHIHIYTHSCTHMYTTHMHSHTYINTHVVQKLPSFTCPQRWGLNDVLKCLSLFIAWGRHGTHTYWRTTFFEAISGTFLWILLLEWPLVTCLSNALNMSPDSLGADCHLVVYSDILFVF